MIMRLLALLGKILGEIRRQMRVHPDEELLNAKQLDMLEAVTRVCRQQKNHFKSGDSRESIPNRIVSVSKPYIRPIVRGKETKTVEFGAKCNNIAPSRCMVFLVRSFLLSIERVLVMIPWRCSLQFLMIQINSEQTVRKGILPLQPDTMFNPLKRDDMGYYDDETYDECNGTYVQDVEGWSDQMIDDALDGESDAYWNID